jgi:hypothetical protein
MSAAPGTTPVPDLLASIDALQATRRIDPARRDQLDAELVQLRHDAVDVLDRRQARAEWPPTYADPFPGFVGIPEVAAAELDAATMGGGIVHHGSILVRGLVPPEGVARLVDGIEAAFDAYSAWFDDGATAEATAPWFVPFEPRAGYDYKAFKRGFVRQAGGVWTVDSPRMLAEVLELGESTGLTAHIASFLGERPVVALDKMTLRRVPLDCGNGWHQDGAFLGSDIRTVNVWIALTDCGGDDSDTPALEVVPRRIDHIVATGTPGAPFETFVSPTVVDEVSAGVGVTRPRFAAGDALIFDHLYLHQTYIRPTMTRERYALESWFFAPSVFPADQIPLVV